MAASIFIHHVIGDLTVGKPEVVEFLITESVEAAIKAIGECAEGAITVWKKDEGALRKSERFVGMLNSLDVVGFIAINGEEAMKREVGDVVKADKGLLKEVDPGTRLIDALDMMKQGVRRLLVRKSTTWRGVSKRFSFMYNGKWLKTPQNLSSNTITPPDTAPPIPAGPPKEQPRYCCLTREDVVRFLISRLGALAPLPLSSISSLDAVNPNYYSIPSSSPAIDAFNMGPKDPCAVAVVEPNWKGNHKLVGEISAYKLWKCDYPAAAWAMANLSAQQFVIGDNNNNGPGLDCGPPEFLMDGAGASSSSDARPRPKMFSSRSIGFFSNNAVRSRSMYRRSAVLTCRRGSSLAAVMAQMLSHRATHVWVVEFDEEEEEEVLVGVVSYTEIIAAVTKQPSAS